MGLGYVSRPDIGGRGSRWFIFLGTFVTHCFMAIGPPIWITDDFEALVFVAKFKRPNPNTTHAVKPNNEKKSSEIGSKGSYANVVSEKNTTIGVGAVKLVKDEKEVKRMVLNENDLIKMDYLAEAFLEKVREVEVMTKRYGILEHQGFNGFEGNYNFDFACSRAIGHYGGIVSMWDTTVFVKSHIQCGVNYVVVARKWMGVQGVCHVINEYASQTVEAKKCSWEEIRHYMQSKISHLIVFVDFNEVRYVSERFGSVYNQQGANDFNEFINQIERVDLNIRDRKFMWINKSRTKMSKLDSYKEFGGDQQAACNYLKNKMKYLKGKIKDWHKDFKIAQTMRSKSLCSKIGDIKDKMDDMTASEEEVSQWIFWLKELAYIKRLDGTDADQKSKIKWEVECDGNTTFFHGFLNQRRRKQMVQGVMEHGQWHTDPETITNVFVDFYRQKFDAVQTHMSALDRIRFSQLDTYDIGMLERPCSIEEVKAADDIYNMVTAFCNEGKLPIGCNASFITLIPKVSNPVFVKDYWPISLIRFQYKIIAKMLAIRLSHVINKLINSEQPTFVKCGQILDGPLIVGEMSNMLRATGCAAGITPFKYLAIPVGASMARTSRWDGVIQRFHNHLSKRKDKVFVSKDREGLEIGRLALFNLTLLQKWQWRCYNESGAIWWHVIKAIHGYHGRVKTSLYCKVRDRWNDGGWMWKWRRDVRGGIEQS
uniref:RNA-directed DNA polymerase, eukaryota, reverse transcriptase zinc-binding domain protein n=1 Tax=Tanacetum cinerariifolium TaxID=118510 RepID=A0A699GPL4_TANCI|nr:RNA-directed DNA polymerase, eukaryota, reverse transcriptase zinc-binding domain protein [Tanacetum cinerariifolium]